MSIATFVNFDALDLVAFVVCCGLGYFAGTFAPAGSAVALYGSILVAYHLFLFWLVFFSDGRKNAGVSLPVVHTLVTHIACLVVILGPVVVARQAIRHFEPAGGQTVSSIAATYATVRLFQALCSSAAAFAVFERGWLFSSETAAPSRPQLAPEPGPATALRSDASEAEEWHRYLEQQKPGAFNGTSIKAEYEKWLAARRKSRQTTL